MVVVLAAQSLNTFLAALHAVVSLIGGDTVLAVAVAQLQLAVLAVAVAALQLLQRSLARLSVAGDGGCSTDSPVKQ